jgi:cell division protein FtsQ
MKIHPNRAKQLKRQLLWLAGAGLVFLIIAAAVQYKRTAPIRALQVVQVANEENRRFIQEEDIRDLLFQKFGNYMEGQPANKVPIEAIEKALEENLFIKKADVYIDAWNNLNIAIEQRKPLLRVMDLQDESYYLDAEGVKVPVSIKYTAHVLVVTGDVGVFAPNYKEVKENRLRKVFELAKFIQQEPFLSKQIDHIHLDPNGHAYLTPKLGDHQIFFGDMEEDVADKFERLKIFYQKGLAYEGWEKYKLINLAFKGQIVAKKR